MIIKNHIKNNFKISEQYLAKSPGGESPAEVELRAIPIIYDLLRRPFKNYLIVGKYLLIIFSIKSFLN